MAAGWSVLDALNKNSKAAADEKPSSRFRTRDISIRKMYTNDRNFYSMQDIEELAQDIMTCGMLENMTVTYAPCDRGEYRIIAGERRYRALKLLTEKGYPEFEIATCQIKSPAEEHEETVQLIMANAYRDKTVVDILEEEKQLKASLQYMKKNGLTLQGYKLDSGRLRDVIASIMNTTGTKVAQIESINNRLIPEFRQELKEGRLTFSAAYEISGMGEERQQEMLDRYKETGSLTWKDVKEAKQAAVEAEKEKQIPGQMEYPEDYEDGEEDQEQQEDEEQQEQEPTDSEITGAWEDLKRRITVTKDTTKGGLIEQLVKIGRQHRAFTGTNVEHIECSIYGIQIIVGKHWITRKKITWTRFVNRLIEGGLFIPAQEVDAHPQTKESVCYGCNNYEICDKKQTNVTKCGSFVDRMEAQKTDEDRYSEEQDEIDRETKQKLEEMQDKKQRQQEAERPARTIRCTEEQLHDVEIQRIPYMIVRQDRRQYKEGDRITLIAMKDGRATGKILKTCVTCADDETTSSGIVEGYAVIGLMDIYDAESLGLVDLGDEE